jgi:hypothetical protein
MQRNAIYNHIQKYGVLGYNSVLLKMRMFWDVTPCRLAELSTY